MTRWLAWMAGWFVSVTFAASPELSPAEIEGRQLARQLQELRPMENSSLSGILRIFPTRNQRVEVPVEFRTILTETNWQVLYIARGPEPVHATTIRIVRNENQPNQYQVSPSGSGEGETNATKVLTGDQAMIPFAESDFWLADLGLEFFSWPQQKLLKKELRSGQACSVLESTNPKPGEGSYARVVSWIDIDTGGIVHAEAYDTKGSRLKRFEPKALKKVNGQWQLQEMVIRNLKTGSRTSIQFDLQSK